MKNELILDTALQLFVEYGYEATPISMLADKAKIAIGTIYRYYPSKNDIANALFQKWKKNFHDELQEGFPIDASIREKFKFLFFRMVSFYKKHPTAFEFLEFHYHSSYLNQKSLQISEEMMKFLRNFVQEEKVFKDMPPDAIAGFVMGAFTGIIRTAKSNTFILSDNLLKMIEENCWQALTK